MHGASREEDSLTRYLNDHDSCLLVLSTVAVVDYYMAFLGSDFESLCICQDTFSYEINRALTFLILCLKRVCSLILYKTDSKKVMFKST